MVLFEHRSVWVDIAHSSDLFLTGFLIIEASFVSDPAYSATFANLLKFNELFRYWRVPYPEHSEIMRAYFGDVFGDRPESVYLKRWLDLLNFPFKDPDDHKLYNLFPYEWQQDAQSWWNSEAVNEKPVITDGKPGWICYADNRVFVWGCAVMNGGTKVLAEICNVKNENVKKLGGWIKFLNVQKPGELSTINTATAFEKEWVKSHSYDRWLHSGTLYGFNYHAGVLLTPPRDDPPVVTHFHNQYMDMALLLMYLRITLFRFSNELTDLSADMRKRKTGLSLIKNIKHRHEFKRLRREFAVFTNLYQFPLISNQQQAIEIYALIRKNMDIKDLFAEIEAEIKSSHEYFEFEQTSLLNLFMFVLTLIAVIIAYRSM